MPHGKNIKAKVKNRRLDVPGFTAGLPETFTGGFSPARALDDLKDALQAGANLAFRKADEQAVLQAEQAETQLRADLALDSTLTELAFYEMHPEMPWLPGLGDSIRPIIGGVKGNNDGNLALADYGDNFASGQILDIASAQATLDKAVTDYGELHGSDAARIAGFSEAIEQHRPNLLREAGKVEGTERVKESYRVLSEGHETALEVFSEDAATFVNELEKLRSTHELVIPGGEAERDAILLDALTAAGEDPRYQENIRGIVEEVLRRDLVRTPDVETAIGQLSNKVDSIIDTQAKREEAIVDRSIVEATRAAKVQLAKDFDPATGRFKNPDVVEEIRTVIPGGDQLIVDAIARGNAIHTALDEGPRLPPEHLASMAVLARSDPESAKLLVGDSVSATTNRADSVALISILDGIERRDAQTGAEAEAAALSRRNLRDELASVDGLELDAIQVADAMEEFDRLIEEDKKSPAAARLAIKKGVREARDLETLEQKFNDNPRPTTLEGIGLRRDKLLEGQKDLIEAEEAATEKAGLSEAHFRSLAGGMESIGRPGIRATPDAPTEFIDASSGARQARAEQEAASADLLKNKKALIDLEKWEQTVREEKAKKADPEQGIQTSFWTNTVDDTILRISVG